MPQPQPVEGQRGEGDQRPKQVGQMVLSSLVYSPLGLLENFSFFGGESGHFWQANVTLDWPP